MEATNEETSSKDNSGKEEENVAAAETSSTETGSADSSQGQKVSRWTKLAKLHRLHLLVSAASGVPYDPKLLEGGVGGDRVASNRKSFAVVGVDETDACRIDMAGASRGMSMSAHFALDDDDDDDDDVEGESETTAHGNNYIKSAIPYLPRGVAVICLVSNIVIPGTGTMLSGLSVICCGNPRLKTKDGQYTGTVCVNLLVGVMQLFTVTFLLVGWIWSFVWGIYMVLLAVEQSKRIRAKHKTELKVKTLTAMNDRLRAWTLRQNNRDN